MPGHKSFLGFEVKGEVYTPSNRPAKQRPAEDLQPVIQEVLSHPNVKAVSWYQYTPYFNDGEPCVFRVGEVTVKYTDTKTEDEWLSEEHGPDEYYDEDSPDGFESLPYRSATYPNAETPAKPGEDVVRKFADLIDSGAFNDVLLQAFGDHAQIVLTAEGFTVDSYEHD